MATLKLADYIRELRAIAPEKPLVPELKGPRQDQDKKIKEEQDLVAGAVLQGPIEAGQGEETPGAEDLVYVQYSVRYTDSDSVITSTRSDEGGANHAFAFRLLKGLRMPRGMELAVAAMTRMQRVAVKVRPDYGYDHPDCTAPAPKGLKRDKFLTFDMQLVNWYPAESVRHLGSAGDMYKRQITEGNSWESPRAPFEVTVRIKACTPAHNGVMMGGVRYYSSERDNQDAGAAGQPLCVQMGSGRLPPGVEEALGHMSRGETSIFVIPAERMVAAPPLPPSDAAPTSPTAPCCMPDPPPGATQVEVQIELISLIQVRDLTGTGAATKRRLRDGQGEFPMDCPLNDTTVRIHYRARPIRKGVAGAWAFDTRQQQQQQQQPTTSVSAAEDATVAASEAGSTPPLEIDTGCGEAPLGLEMCVKLMVPGELASVTCTLKYAYGERDDPPAGISGQDDVEFEVELLGFDKEGYWQSMSMEERFALAERMKGKANELYRLKKYEYARSRYDRLGRLLDSTRDFEHQEDVDRMASYQLAVAGNLAACCLGLADYARAIEWCDKAMKFDNVDVGKMLLRRGRARSLKGDFEAAEEDLQAALEAEQAPPSSSSTQPDLAGQKLAGQPAVQPVVGRQALLQSGPNMGQLSGSVASAASGTDVAGGTAAAATSVPPVAATSAASAADQAARVAAVEAEIAANKQRAKVAASKQKQQFRNFFDRT